MAILAGVGGWTALLYLDLRIDNYDILADSPIVKSGFALYLIACIVGVIVRKISGVLFSFLNRTKGEPLKRVFSKERCSVYDKMTSICLVWSCLIMIVISFYLNAYKWFWLLVSLVIGKFVWLDSSAATIIRDISNHINVASIENKMALVIVALIATHALCPYDNQTEITLYLIALFLSCCISIIQGKRKRSNESI